MLRPPAFVAALLLPLPALAAVETAPLEVSLTVKESCSVEHDDAVAARPGVACALDSPFRVQAGAAKQLRPAPSAPSAVQHPAPAQWEVVF